MTEFIEELRIRHPHLWGAVDELGAFHTNLNGGGDKYEQFSQEIQFIGTTERTEYVAGLYYFDDKTTSAPISQ